MSLTFSNFKQMLPSQILAKGRDYVRQGHILDLSFDEDEIFWEAQIRGTEIYDVRIEQSADGSLNCSCTCPYDQGEYCKHIAAVLYTIEDAFPDQLGTKPRKKPAKRQTRHDKLRQILEKTSHEQLVTILLNLTEQDRELLNQLLMHLESGDAKSSDYRRVVKNALRVGRDEYGFLDYAGSNRAGRKVEELLTQADRWLEKGEINKAVSMYQAVMDETVPIISHADDSNGLLGNCLNVAVNGLKRSIEQLDEMGRERLFVFCVERARQTEFHDWDWGWDLFAIAVEMVENPDRRMMLMTALDAVEVDVQKPENHNYHSNFALERVASLKLAVIDRFDGRAAAREFLQTHVHLDRMRMVLIERCIDNGTLDEAMHLIQEGISSSTQRKLPGLTFQYQALHVKLLQRTGDKADLIDAIRTLWLNRGDVEDFVLLQQTVPVNEWESFVGGLINDLQRNPEQLAWLYARENRWRDLMTVVQAQGARLIETFRDSLEIRFPDEVTDLYEKILEEILLNASGRNHYRHAVAYLRRIKKLNKLARLESIVQRLKKQYAHRPALLDELQRSL